MRPDPDSDLAGAQSEYGDDTGFAADATRTPEQTDASGESATGPAPGPDEDTAGLTAEDEEPGNGAD